MATPPPPRRNRPLLKVLLLGWLLFWMALIQGEEAVPVRLGVLAKSDPVTAGERWQPTADYLTRRLPGYRFELVPLDYQEIDAAAAERRIDLLITNPSSFVKLDAKYGASAILTLQRQLISGDTSPVFAAAIVVRSDRQDIQHIADLRGKHLSAVDEESFDGWAVAWRQMRNNGLDPWKELSSIDFAGSHENVVRAVMSGAVDAGTVRSGVLERMVAAGELSQLDFRVLPEESKSLHQPFELPEWHSTPYYPEWPLVRLAHADHELARQVAQALLALPAADPAAQAAEIGGWVPPLSYAPVHELMQELKLAQYEHYGRITLAGIVEQYWRWIALGLALLVLMAVALIHVTKLNIRNRESTQRLQQELAAKAAAEREILAQKERLGRVIDSIVDAYFAVDGDWRITAMNRSAQESLGVSRNAPAGQDLWNTFPELAAITHSSFSRSFELEQPIEFIACYQPSQQWFEFHTCPSGNEMGVYFRDVTDRIRATQLLEESEQRLRAILENMLEGVIIIDAHGRIQGFNRAAQAVFGYGDDEVLGRSLDILMPTSAGRHDNFIGNYLATGITRVIGIGRQLHGRRKSGEPFPMDISVSEIMNGGERIFVGICRDVSEQKRSQERVRQLAVVMEHLEEGVFIADSEGWISYANPAYAAMLGVHSETLPGQRATLFELAARSQDQYRHFRETRWQAGESWRGHYSAQRSNGLHYIEAATIAPVLDDGGTVVAYVGVCRDVTQALRRQLQQSHLDRIEVTATLASGIARECSGMIAAIIEQTNGALAKIDPHTVAGQRMTQVLGVASRARVLVRELLAFSTQEFEQPQRLDPHQLVKGGVALLQSLLPAAVSVRQRIEPGTGELWMAPGQFQWVIVALALRIIQAVDGQAGVVEVRLGRHVVVAGAASGTELAEGDYLLLMLAESVTLPGGDQEGVDQEISAIEEIIRRNGGTLHVDREGERGAMFQGLSAAGGPGYGDCCRSSGRGGGVAPPLRVFRAQEWRLPSLTLFLRPTPLDTFGSTVGLQG